MVDFNQNEIYNNINSLFEAKAEVQHEINRNELVLESVEENILKYVKSIFRPLNSKMLVHTWKHWHDVGKTGKLDLYDSISSLVFEELMNTFLKDIEGVTIHDIIGCGHEHYAMGFEFLIGDKKIRIDYPCIENITKQNLSYAYYGKFVFSYEKSPSYWEVIKLSYDEKEIADAIKLFLEPY